MPAERLTGAALLNIRGDFGSVRDSRGWAQFSPFLLTLLETHDPLADEWCANWKARGYTHIVITPEYGYPGSPIAGMTFTAERFVAHVETVLNRGFAPILMLTDVPAQMTRGLQVVDLLKSRGLLPFVILVPGWELVPSLAWTSKQVSDALIAIEAHATGAEHYIGMHLQPGRWAISSNPVESDDPWQGAESGCWKSHGGEFVDIFLYQFEHGFTQTTAPDWQNRWRDGVPRMGTGMNGWRVMPIAAFETVLYDSYQGHCDEARARQIAGEARDIAMREFGVTVSYGNGCP